jgi:hypothetical protein
LKNTKFSSRLQPSGDDFIVKLLHGARFQVTLRFARSLDTADWMFRDSILYLRKSLPYFWQYDYFRLYIYPVRLGVQVLRPANFSDEL